MTDLDPKSTFETFVVGPANRLASAAARRAAESPGTAYNPLFIYSASGLGKSHILMAMAHHSQRTNERLRTRYKTLEGFLQDLESALEAGNRESLRDAYRDLDILLLDDIQFLAGQPEAQEMLLTTLDALSASESQIVLASDRPPAEIDGLDARLVSRFSGGLIVDIAPPELETRIAIIHRKVHERGQTLEPGVAEALGRYPFRNIRELGGALNRVLATQELEERRLAAEEIPAIMGVTVEIEAETGVEATDATSDAAAAGVDAEVEIREEPWRKRTRETIEAAEREGYRTTRIAGLLEEDAEPAEWEATLMRYGEDISRLREIDRELTRLGNPWPEASDALLRDPDRREEAEAFIASVRERMRPFPKLSEGPDLDHLDAEFPGIALKAARQIIGPERPEYNPLFLWSGGGEAATHLLAAAGRSWGAHRPDERMAVTSVRAFSEDFIRALGGGVAGAWRERWWTVDLLLVYGAEALSDTERAQDEFFHLFEALKRRGSRVIMAADRPPSEIEKIDERLRSRFEGGLVLEVAGRADGEPLEVAFEDPSPSGAAESGSSWDDVARAARIDAESGGEVGETVVPPLEEITFGDRGGLFVDTADDDDPMIVVADDVVHGDAEAPQHAEAPASIDVAAEEDEPSPATTAWRPSREKVVWVWPAVIERLVRELD
ncbi:MAG: DnaA/Hda family protein [Longimicrobiales bacterium]|nr:DnaA/Hda family protein [Longimicrobiales bacterium]